jgi:chromosome segregation ATPase
MALPARVAAALALCLQVCLASKQGASAQTVANPIRRVVALLQNMQEKVKAEGEKEADLYSKFKCYCKTGVGELESRIAAAGTAAPQLEASITGGEEKLAQTKQALADAQKERADAKGAIASAESIREKDATAFAKTKSELEGYLSQISAAVASLENGMAGSFLQARSSAAALRGIVEKSEVIGDDDKELVMSFLSGRSSYAPKSGEITGILKQMGDEFAKSLKAEEDAEAAAIKDYEALVAAKSKEIDVLTVSIEQKLTAVGQLSVSIVQMKADFEDEAGSLLEDKKMLADLQAGCSTKDAEYEARVKTRNEELLALAETIKLLNDDDALELFKKTLPAPSASLMQVQVTRADVRARALSLLQRARGAIPKQARLEFLVLALRGKKVGFEKVISMIDGMVSALKKEQLTDSDKKEYCLSTFDSTEDKKKELEHVASDTETAIASAEENIAALAEEIAEAEKSIKALDASVSEATAIRKAENEDYKALVQSDSAAKELLLFAKNRLNKFYNPKLYNPPAKVELSEMGAIERDMSFVQISEHAQRRSDVEPPPETWDAYAKKTQESNGVIAMIDLLVKDLDTELTEAATEEKNSQEQYDKTIADAKAERVGLSKSLTGKSAAKADTTADLEGLQSTEKSTAAELMATDKFLSGLHAECDWLLKYFTVREDARNGEIEALGKAKAILSGASYE